MSFALINDGQIMDRISEGCRKKRLLLNMTQEALSTKANVSLNTIKKFERGEPFSFRTIISVLRALGEIGRLQELILNLEESPEEIFLREQSSKPARKRASRER